MSIWKLVKDSVVGTPSALMSSAERAAVEQAEAEKARAKGDDRGAPAQGGRTAKGAKAAKPAATRPSEAVRRADNVRRARTTTRPAAPGAPRLPAEASSAREIRVALPSGRLAEHGWEPLMPISLSTLYAANLSRRAEALIDSREDLRFGDDAGRLLRHVSPLWAAEEKSWYELDTRFYTTLGVKRWEATYRPELFQHLVTTSVPLAEGGSDRLSFVYSLHHSLMPASVAIRDTARRLANLRLERSETEAREGRQSEAAVRLAAEIARLEELRDEVLYTKSRFFLVSGYVRLGGATSSELAASLKATREAFRRMSSTTVKELPGEQRSAYVSTMPFGENPANFSTLRDSTRAAELFPFVTRVVQERDKADRLTGVLYGIQRYNGTPVVVSPFNRDETVDVTTILGNRGGGKSFWLRTHMGRMAMTGVQIIAIDPLGDFTRFFSRNGGQVLQIRKGSSLHVNPFRREYGYQVINEQDPGSATIEGYEAIDRKTNLLMPLFELILGEEYNGVTKPLLGAALGLFYAEHGTEERLMVDFVTTLRGIRETSQGPLPADWLAARDRLVTTLTLKCLDQGQYADFFAYPSSLSLRANDTSSRLVCFDLSGLDGETLAFSVFLAVTMARSLAMRSMSRKLFLVDEVHRIFRANKVAAGISETLDDLARTCRHWQTALTFATQFLDEDSEINKVQAPILKTANMFILFRATAKMLAQASDLVGPEVAPVEMLRTQILEDRERVRAREESRPAIVFRNDRAVPIWSIGLPFEVAEDNPDSGVAR